MNTSDKALLAALTDLSGIGDARAYELYTHFDDPFDLLSGPESLTNDFHYIDNTTVNQLQSLDDTLEAYRQRFATYESEGITILGIDDTQYPASVRTNPAPPLLYAKGNVELLDEPAIGVSGSRDTNTTGKQWIRSLAAEIVQDEFVVVSGGARGADTAAHRGAIEADDSTIVILGTGVNVAYPPENESLFEQIIDTGGLLLSMRPPDAQPTSHAFIDRNELIAALSDGMVFVATDGSGGTIAQYNIASELDQPLFVPPETLNIEPSGGLSTLRSSNNTTSIEGASNITEALSNTQSQQMDLDDWT